jgi:hypothetical protein
MDRNRQRCAIALASICLCAAIVLHQVGTARAQAPNRAALVVRYGDGTVWTQCVTFPEDEITGLQLLQRAGLEVVYARGGTGDLLCKIGREGCDNPNLCLCQCKGAQCAYWSYWHLQDGNWQYSVVGASTYRVKPGTIDGWVWGIGTITDAPQPPAVSFEGICRLVAPTALPTLTHTPIPVASPTATPSEVPVVTHTPEHTPSPPASTTAVPSPSSQPSLTASPAPPPASATPMSTPTTAHEPSPTPVVPTAAARPPVRPGGTAYIVFAAIVIVLGIIGAVAWRRGKMGL